MTWEWLKMIHEPLYPIGTVITAFRALAVAFRALVAVFRALVFHCIVIAHEVQSLPIAPLGGTFANTRGLAGGISSSRMHTCCNWNLIELCISKTNISFYPQVWAVTWPFSHCHFVRCPLLVCDSSSEASLVLLSPVISMAISRSPSTGAGSLVRTSTPASESLSSLKTVPLWIDSIGEIDWCPWKGDPWGGVEDLWGEVEDLWRGGDPCRDGDSWREGVLWRGDPWRGERDLWPNHTLVQSTDLPLPLSSGGFKSITTLSWISFVHYQWFNTYPPLLRKNPQQSFH